MLAAGGEGWGYSASAKSWVDATQAVCQAGIRGRGSPSELHAPGSLFKGQHTLHPK